MFNNFFFILELNFLSAHPFLNYHFPNTFLIISESFVTYGCYHLSLNKCINFFLHLFVFFISYKLTTSTIIGFVDPKNQNWISFYHRVTHKPTISFFFLKRSFSTFRVSPSVRPR